MGLRSSASDEGSETGASSSNKMSSSSKGVPINPEVISWYSHEIGLDSKIPDQYTKVEENLKERTSGGYWKVIAKGDPLTEKAGNCQEEYCLVRGVGACTTCRAEEMMRRSSSNKQGKVNETVLNVSRVSEGGQNLSGSQQPAKEEKGFVDWLKDSLTGLLGLNK